MTKKRAGRAAAGRDASIAVLQFALHETHEMSVRRKS